MKHNKEYLITSQFELSNYIFNSVKKEHLSQSERDCLLAIANCMNPANNWTCFPSYEAISDTALISVRTAKGCVASMKEKGVISYKQGRSGVSNVYSISISALSKLTGTPAAIVSKQGRKPVDKHPPVVQQSSHQQGFSHPDYDDGEEFDTPF